MSAIKSGNEDFFVTGNPYNLSVPLLFREDINTRPKEVPEGSVFEKNENWGMWFSPEGEELYAVKRPKGVVDQIEKGIHEGKGSLLGAIAPVVDTITSDIPVGIMDGFYSMLEKTGMDIPEQVKNMGREGARGAATMAVSSAIFRNPAVGGASRLKAFQFAFNQVLAGFGTGAAASGVTSQLFGEEYGLQTDEEHRTDLMTTFGASAGGRSMQMLAKAVRDPKFLNAVKRGQDAALLDRVTPPNFRAFTRLAYWLGEVPTPWWAAAGNIGGSAAGFTAATDKSLTSAEGLMSVAAPGIFNVVVARKGAILEQRMGIGGRPEGPAGSWSEAAHELTEKLEEMPIEQRIKRLREYAIWRGVMGNSSTFRGLDTDKVSLAMLVNDINKQTSANRRLDPLGAIRYASELGKQKAVLLFPNQWQGADLVDLAGSLKFVEGRTKRTVMQAIPGENLKFKEVIEDTTNPMVRALKKALPKADEQDGIRLGLYGGQPATDEALNFLGAVEKMVFEAASDPKGDKLDQFGKMVNSLRKAIDDNPTSAPMLERVTAKLKDTFVNEGIFGKAYGRAKATQLPEEISDLDFDGQRILDYLVDNKRTLSSFMAPDEVKSLTQVARLMKAGQDTGLGIGSFQRDIERITSFSTHRLTFYFASGAFLGGGGENPMSRILFGAASVVGGGKAILMGGSALYRLGAKSPAKIKKLVDAHIKGDRITEGIAWRALIRDGNPELANSMGIGDEQMHERSGITSGFFSQHLPIGNPFQ